MRDLLRRLLGRPLEALGLRGERAAARFLRKRGHRILARGSRDLIGELDLVTLDRNQVVFVEVKTRRNHSKGHPVEAVDDRKQQKLNELALAFLKRHGLLESPARFDVIAVTWPDDDRPPQIEHFPHALQGTGRWQFFC